MKLLFDFFPIVLFFIGFKLYGVYVATVIAMVASLLQVLFFWFKYRKMESLHIITLILVVLLGGLTLFLHDAIFIKWKPTALYWAFALVFLGSHFIGKKTLIERLMETKLNLPASVWNKLNFSWIVFFTSMGFINLYVIYHFSTNFWVNFKLFGTLGLTFLFIVLQAVYMAKYLDHKDSKAKSLDKTSNKLAP